MSGAVWFWRYGCPAVLFEYPYVAQSPTAYDRVEFNSVDEVWNEIENIVEETKGSTRTIGQDLFFLVPMFANPEDILDDWHYEMILEWQSSKMLNLPISDTLDNASALKVDSFLIIESEMIGISNYENKKKK